MHIVPQVHVHAPAKINLRLLIVGVRGDGYHLLDSIVAPIRLFDTLVISIRRARTASVRLVCRPEGMVSAGPDNLAARAAALYAARSGLRARVEIELTKRIPAGAGLGGGSSDAAAVLRGLNALSDQPVPPADLAAWALEIGADVPLFLCGRPARMQGIGEQLTPTSLPAAVRGPVVVTFPGTGLATKEVYAGYDDSLTSQPVASRFPRLTTGRAPLRDWLRNDLEAAAFQVSPKLRDLKRQLRMLGARGAMMTGSGSAIFGVWQRQDDAQAAARYLRAVGVWACTTEILERVPAVERDGQHGGRSPSW
ncbi:MAG: 4-(cytidine 5'-diphospho)-2-C-methyl-D-erythritol kinase [Deltaproteobacteria bacterium]|nr:4-(cytidine 5'-diphospho)-2-C-methyl-D-erythritol kinase [Deltaproteobacteria bacterium]